VAGLALSSVIVSTTTADDRATLWQRLGSLFGSQTATLVEEPCEFRGVTLGETEPAAVTPVVTAIKKAWEHELGGEVAARSYVRDRLSHQPSRLHGTPPAADLDDRAFALRIALDTWAGI
jgi:hypothetical protein